MNTIIIIIIIIQMMKVSFDNRKNLIDSQYLVGFNRQKDNNMNRENRRTEERRENQQEK